MDSFVELPDQQLLSSHGLSDWPLSIVRTLGLVTLCRRARRDTYSEASAGGVEWIFSITGKNSSRT